MTTNPTQPSSAASPVPDGVDQTIGQLVSDATRDMSSLIQSEIALAKAELKVSVRNGGLAAGLFAAAAFLLLMSVVMLSVGIAYLIHLTGLDLAWCFLLVFLLYVLVAALLGFIGAKRIKFVGPPARAIEQAKETRTALTKRD